MSGKQHNILMVGGGNAWNAASTRDFGNNHSHTDPPKDHLHCNEHVATFHSLRMFVHTTSGQKLPMAVSEKASKIGGICLTHMCVLAVCGHSMLTASSSGQDVHLVSLRFPLQPSIYCTVPISYCISIYMEYINQVCIWSISTLCLVSHFINLFNTFITGSINLQAPMLLYFLSVLIISFATVQELSCQSVGIQHSKMKSIRAHILTMQASLTSSRV